MDVILLEKLGRFGGIGDRASVKAGYGRNYLVPRGKAVFATEKNIAEFESRRAEPVSYTHLTLPTTPYV